MATDDDLLTFSAFQTYSGAPDSDSTLGGYVISAASRWFRNYTGRILVSQSVGPEYYNGPGGYELILKNRPVTAVASIYQDFDRSWGSGMEISSSSYFIDEDMGKIILNDEVFYEGTKIIKITYTAGYGTVPQDLVDGGALLASYLYDKFKNKSYGKKGVRTQAGNLEYAQDFPREVLRVANYYKKRMTA